MKALDIREDEVFSLMKENADEKSYVRRSDQDLDARRLRALLSHGRAPKIVYAGDSVLRCTVLGNCARTNWGR